MERVLLFSLQNEGIKVTIEAFFDDAGNLVVEGYDIGKTVKDYWGDSDYEYSTTVPPAEVQKLYAIWNLPPDSKHELLAYLQANYHENDCYSKFCSFLEQHHIKSEGFSWR
jgi:hypothetical protein